MTDLAVFPAVTELRRVNGLCYWGPTSLTVEASYGSLLGFSESGVEPMIAYGSALSNGEERGDEPIGKWYLGSKVQIRVILKNWNAATLARAFPGLVSGSNIKYPNDLLAGTRLDSSTYAGKFLFMPMDNCATNPCVLAQYAVPNIEASARLRMRLSEDTNFPIVFDCFRHPSATGGETAYSTIFIGNKSGVTLIT